MSNKSLIYCIERILIYIYIYINCEQLECNQGRKAINQYKNCLRVPRCTQPAYESIYPKLLYYAIVLCIFAILYVQAEVLFDYK